MMMMPRVLAFVAVVMWSAPALGSTFILEDGEEYSVKAEPGYRSTVYFPVDVLSYSNGNAEHWHVSIAGNEMDVQPVKGAKNTNLNVRMENGDRIIVNLLRVQDKPMKQVFFLESELDTPQCKKDEKPDYDQTVRHMRDRWEVRPDSKTSTVAGEHHLSALLAHQVIEGPTLRSRVRLRSHSNGAYAFEHLEVLPNPYAEEAVPALIVWDSDDGMIPTTLDREQDLWATVIVHDADSVGERMAMRLVPSKGNLFPATFEFEDDRPNVRRWTVRAQFIGGAVQLDDGINLSQSDFTGTFGVGARVAYGVSRHLTLEADMAAHKSGKARFDDVVWDGTSGDLERSATSFRLLGGFVLRTGEDYVPFVRGAIGPRLSSDEMALTSGAMSDTKLDSSLAISVETGIDAWVGDKFTAGVAGAFVSDIAGEASIRSFEARVHLGYAWKRWR